jgi:hypothetical protein
MRIKDMMCSAADCSRNARARTPLGPACPKHYLRYWNNGDFSERPLSPTKAEYVCSECGSAVVQNYRQNKTRMAKPKFCSSDCYHTHRRRKTVRTAPDRFWAKVQRGADHECWPWVGHRNKLGYGRFTYVRGETQQATRIAWLLWHGSLPPDNLQVCHACDNPPCVNPHHLWLGTGKENMQDMSLKGRHNPNPRRGELSNKSKLTADDALAIYHSEEPNRTLADRYGVSPTAIYWIKAGKNWAHVTGAKDAA